VRCGYPTNTTEATFGDRGSTLKWSASGSIVALWILANQVSVGSPEDLYPLVDDFIIRLRRKGEARYLTGS
jgi:hypothetical protein